MGLSRKGIARRERSSGEAGRLGVKLAGDVRREAGRLGLKRAGDVNENLPLHGPGS
jgi:hypothetical protein